MGRNDCEGSVRSILLFSVVFGCCTALAQTSAVSPAVPLSKCPIGFGSVDVRYNHAGGESVPQLRLSFTNQTGKTITDLVFSLSIFDSDGSPVSYPSDFHYHHEFPPGQAQRSHTWNLDPASVDMHRTGESVMLLEARFADGTGWKDDGAWACTLAFDYRPK
ncbi:MAG: hypothetical protein JO300_05870 [Silvibacterium sp.]|nr:hypothetical protein [Silvibacterium sp.]MBV8438590.1 hypothetical protein [Silvibacterium sp.]